MSFLQRRRARFLIMRGQSFADEPLVAVANFTWVGNSMGAPPGVRDLHPRDGCQSGRHFVAVAPIA
jgi:hypothetical protein